MSLPTWPGAVPYEPFDDLWKNTPLGNAHLVTEMEAGNVRVRRRPWVLPVLEWGRLLKPDAMATFKTFVESDLSQGASRFRMMVCLDGSTFTERTVQMEPASLGYASAGNSLVRVTFRLWVFPPAVVS
jgi:hypothetical protein